MVQLYWKKLSHAEDEEEEEEEEDEEEEEEDDDDEKVVDNTIDCRLYSKKMSKRPKFITDFFQQKSAVSRSDTSETNDPISNMEVEAEDTSEMSRTEKFIPQPEEDSAKSAHQQDVTQGATSSDKEVPEHQNPPHTKHDIAIVFENAICLADGFLHSLRTQTTVQMSVDKQHAKNVKESRERLTPIIKTVILCARLGIAYRGQRKN
ncbi:uncharacterized protein LOC135199600 [Macrobrachium nipponense]|uniref:uncharacterized protein LOC135199600 n=1 Tax=Macrobrachium nipponense TaxID=159736 RepID=UPI0030C7E68C